MKLLTILALVFSAQTYAAGDEKLCEYLKEKTLDEYTKYSIASEKVELKKIIGVVSKELDKKRQTQCKEGNLGAVIDYDSCSSLCIKNSVSETRLTAAMLTMGKIIDLPAVTRECQSYCKGYQMSAFAFKDGVKAAEVQDCTGHVDTTSRKNTKASSSGGVVFPEKNKTESK